MAKGRGVFTTKPIKCGEMIFAEKPITTWSEFIDMKRPDMQRPDLKKLSELVKLKGIEALRLNQLYDGDSKDNLKIPPIDIFTRNNYKHHLIADISIAKLQRICWPNVVSINKDDLALYGFQSFLNHEQNNEEQTLVRLQSDSGYVVCQAKRDLDWGEEIMIDYQEWGHTDLDKP